MRAIGISVLLICMSMKLGFCLDMSSWGSENFLTLGYDAFKGFPDATGRDPGFTRPIFVFQSNSPSFFFTPDVGCVTSFTSKTVKSSSELKNEMDSRATFDTAGFGARFTANQYYKEAKEEMESKHEIFIYSGALCSYFYAEVNSEEFPDLQESLQRQLTRILENPNDVKKLKSFLGIFGTHFVRSMRFGASFKYIYKMSSKSYSSLIDNNIDANDLASAVGADRTQTNQFSSKYSEGVKRDFESQVSVKTVSVGATPPSNGDTLTWAANVKKTPAPIQTIFSPIYDLLDHKNFSGLPSRKIREAKEAIKSALKGYCEDLREEEALESCSDISDAGIVVLPDAYPDGVKMCKSRAVEDCSLDARMKLLGGIEVNTYDECHSRCSNEPGCVLTAFVVMTNMVEKRCYLYQEGAQIFPKKVAFGNNANVKEAKITILASKLSGSTGIELLGGIQVNRNTQPLSKQAHRSHAGCYNACKADSSCRVSMFCKEGCSDLITQKMTKKCYFYGKNIIINNNFDMEQEEGYKVNIFRGIH